MHLLGEQLLADAALAEYEHRGFRFGDARDQVELLDDERRLGDEVVPALLRLNLVAQIVNLLLGLLQVAGVLDRQGRLDREYLEPARSSWVKYFFCFLLSISMTPTVTSRTRIGTARIE